MRHSIAALVCAAALVGVAGCGGDDDSSAEDVAQDLVDARNVGNHARFCELLSDEVRERYGGNACPAFIEEQSSGAESAFELLRVEEEGDRAVAVVRLTTEDSGAPTQELQIGLREQDGEWRVASLAPPGAD